MKRILKLVFMFPCWLLLAGYYTGSETITTSGTPVKLSAASPVPPSVCVSLTVQAQSSNTGTVYIGGSNVSAANKIGLALTPSSTPPSSAYFAPSGTLALYAPETVYVDSTASGDKVNYTCYK